MIRMLNCLNAVKALVYPKIWLKVRLKNILLVYKKIGILRGDYGSFLLYMSFIQ